MAETGLKRLEFVRTFATSSVVSATDVAGKVYTTAKKFTPSIVTPYIATVEEKAISYSAPVLTVVQDVTDQLLRHVDDHLDSVMGTYDNRKTLLTSQIKNLHDKNAEYYTYAKDAYLKLVEQAVDLVQKQRSSLSASAQYALDALKTTVQNAKESTEKNATLLVSKVPEAFEKLLAFPLVAKTLESATPAVSYAKVQYIKAHDLVVADPTYKRIFDSGVTVVTKVQEATLFKKTMATVYPFIAPVASPALDIIQKQGLPQLLLDHIKPVAPVA